MASPRDHYLTVAAGVLASALITLTVPSTTWGAPSCDDVLTAQDHGGEDVFLLEDECWTGEHTNIGRLTIGPAFTLQAQPGTLLTIEAVEVYVLGHLSADEAGYPGGATGGRGEGGDGGTGTGAGANGVDVPDCALSGEVVLRNAGGGGGGGAGYGGDGGDGGFGADAADSGCQGQAGGDGGDGWATIEAPVAGFGAGGGGGGGAGGAHSEQGTDGAGGGGAISITARTLNIGAVGRISADGGDGGRGGTSEDIFHGGGGGGGAAGGGIYIRTTFLEGEGVISAVGGDGGEGGAGDVRDGVSFNGAGGGGGGGGLILVERSVATEWSGLCSATGGSSGSGENGNSGPSAAGTDGECLQRHANGAPTADAGGPYAGAEGADIVLDGSASTDPDGDDLTYDWDLGCDGSFELNGATVTTYYDDDDVTPYQICLRTSDSEFSHTAPSFVTVFDAAPVADIALPAENPIEGATFAVSAAGSSADGGGRIDDTIAAEDISWDFEYDVLTGFVDRGVTGPEQNHQYADNGRYFIAVKVVDDDSGEATKVVSIDINNDPPVITNPEAWPQDATEAIEWSYQMEISDAGVNDTHDYEVLSGPLGMTVTETGLFAWTPIYAHALEDEIVARISVTDNDFGRAILPLTITVTAADSDSDGMPDGWELDQIPPLDPNVDDADGDPDQDGVSNLEEFERDSDPRAFEGPGAPRLAYPPLGFEIRFPVDTEVSVFQALDPDNSPLTYKVAIYDVDPESVADVEPFLSEDGIEPMGVTAAMALEPEDGLEDNTRYWWRAWAFDGLVYGPPSETGHFFVNARQDCPTVPTLLTPANGGRVTSRQPVFVVGNASDQDQDPIMYWFLIYEDATLRNALLNSGLIEEGAGTTTTWQPDTELLDHQEYYWRAKAVDAEGCESDFSYTWSFLTTIGNLTPTAPVIVAPADGSTTTAGRPTIVVENAVDPDRDFLTYVFEIDTETTFDSENYQQSGSVSEGLPHEGTSWVVPDTLADNAMYYVRVQANDGEASGPFAESTFRVNYINDPPTAPIPINPPDGGTIENQRPRLTVENAVDPDGETLVYHFQVYTDPQMEELAIERDDVPESTEISFWRVNQALLSGPYWWRARASDHSGGGPWSELNRFTITLARRNDDVDAGPGDTDGATTATTPSDDCGCTASHCGLPGLPLAFFALALFALRRRRHSA